MRIIKTILCVVLVLWGLSAFTQDTTHVSGTISSSTTWTTAGSPYVVTGDVTVADGVTLTILPGVIVKFEIGNYDLQIDGTLIANGTSADSIIFTSYKDDAYGGDSNDYGQTTQPAPGDWKRVYFNGANSNSLLGWVIISYARYSNEEAFYLNNCDIDMSECIIIHNQDEGIAVSSNATLDITNSDIYDNGYGLLNAGAAIIS